MAYFTLRQFDNQVFSPGRKLGVRSCASGTSHARAPVNTGFAVIMVSLSNQSVILSDEASVYPSYCEWFMAISVLLKKPARLIGRTEIASSP